MGRTWLTASLIFVVMAEGSLAGVLAADTGNEASARPSEAPAPMSSGAEVSEPVEADSGVAADTGSAEARLQSEDAEVDVGRLDAARQVTALYLMALILVLVVIFVLVLTLGRRLVFQRGKPLRPTRLEDLWWKMNADVGPFPKDAAGTTAPDEEDDRTGDAADDE